MKNVLVAIFLVLFVSFLFTGCEDSIDDTGSDSVYVTMQYYDFSSSNINLNVTLGDGGTSNYNGTYVIYSENWSDFADGISLHFLVPGNTGSMALPGLEWLILKIQKDSMTPGIYTLDDTDSNYQLSSPGQVKLYYNDADNVKHAGSGQITISTLDWSHSGNETASLSIAFSLENVTLGTGRSSSSTSKSISDTGSVEGSFQGQASISEDDTGSLVGTQWRGSYSYYGVPVVETLSFTSSYSCTGRTEADGSYVEDIFSYTYDPGSRTGTLTGDSTMSFSINSSFTILTFNNVSYYKQ